VYRYLKITTEVLFGKLMYMNTEKVHTDYLLNIMHTGLIF